MPISREKLIKRFYNNILVAEDGCWNWQKSKDQDGYGVFRFLGENRAHRASFAFHLGPIMTDAFICHKCDNPSCVNPKHLFMGTADSNNKDRARKGRSVSHAKNKTHCKRGHKFTEENTRINKKGYRSCRECCKIRVEELVQLKTEGKLPISNVPKKTHCKRGHKFTEENTYIDRKGGRVCRICKRVYENNNKRKLKGKL